MAKKTETIMALCQPDQIQHHLLTNIDVDMLLDILLDMKQHNKKTI